MVSRCFFYFNYVNAVIGTQLLYMSRYSLETVQLTAVFNSVRLDTVNDVATLRLKRSKHQFQQWFNDETHKMGLYES